MAKSQKDYVYEGSDSDEYRNDDQESEDEEDLAKKKKKNKKTNKPKDNKWESAFDDEGKDLDEVGVPKKGKSKDDKPKRPRKAKEMMDPNKIKTNNKLLGDIENRDLYNSDEEVGQPTTYIDQETLKNT
jgi:hypothetical protein